MAEVVSVVDKLNNTDMQPECLSEFLGAMINLLSQCAKDANNADKTCTETIKSIRADESIALVPTDKTSRMIALNKMEYDDMLHAATLSTGNFKITKKIQPTTQRAYFNKSITKIANKYTTSNPTISNSLSKLKCSNPVPSSPYVLPKNHKIGPLKVRPIVAALDCRGNKLSKFMSNKLNSLMPFIPSFIKDANDLLNKLNDTDLSLVTSFGCFDVVNLYGSIPRIKRSTEDFDLKDAIKTFYSDFAHYDLFLSKLHVEDFCELVDLSISKDTILYHEQHFTQQNGISMGSPIAPQLAIIYMHYVEQQILASNPSILKWWRYIDDIFVLVENDVTSKLLQPIKLTLEQPNQSNFLPFLDIEISIHHGTFESKLYMKPQHSG